MLCPVLDHLCSTSFCCLSDLDTSFSSLTLIDKFKCILSANKHCKITCTKLETVIVISAIILYLFIVTHRPNQAGHLACHSYKIFHSFTVCTMQSHYIMWGLFRVAACPNNYLHCCRVFALSIGASPVSGISSDHICAVRFSVDDGDRSLVSVIGVYMPCSDQGLECYRDHLIQLERVISESSLLSPVVVLGDFNAHLGSLGERKDRVTLMCKVFW